MQFFTVQNSPELHCHSTGILYMTSNVHSRGFFLFVCLCGVSTQQPVTCSGRFTMNKKNGLQTQAPVAHTSPRPYQVGNDVVALLLEPDQNTGGVQSTTVCQDHCTFGHDESVGPEEAAAERQWKKKQKKNSRNHL